MVLLNILTELYKNILYSNYDIRDRGNSNDIYKNNSTKKVIINLIKKEVNSFNASIQVIKKHCKLFGAYNNTNDLNRKFSNYSLIIKNFDLAKKVDFKYFKNNYPKNKNEETEDDNSYINTITNDNEHINQHINYNRLNKREDKITESILISQHSNNSKNSKINFKNIYKHVKHIKKTSNSKLTIINKVNKLKRMNSNDVIDQKDLCDSNTRKSNCNANKQSNILIHTSKNNVMNSVSSINNIPTEVDTDLISHNKNYKYLLNNLTENKDLVEKVGKLIKNKQKIKGKHLNQVHQGFLNLNSIRKSSESSSAYNHFRQYKENKDALGNNSRKNKHDKKPYSSINASNSVSDVSKEKENNYSKIIISMDKVKEELYINNFNNKLLNDDIKIKDDVVCDDIIISEDASYGYNNNKYIIDKYKRNNTADLVNTKKYKDIKCNKNYRKRIINNEFKFPESIQIRKQSLSANINYQKNNLSLNNITKEEKSKTDNKKNIDHKDNDNILEPIYKPSVKSFQDFHKSKNMKIIVSSNSGILPSKKQSSTESIKTPNFKPNFSGINNINNNDSEIKLRKKSSNNTCANSNNNNRNRRITLNEEDNNFSNNTITHNTNTNNNNNTKYNSNNFNSFINNSKNSNKYYLEDSMNVKPLDFFSFKLSNNKDNKEISDFNSSIFVNNNITNNINNNKEIRKTSNNTNKTKKTNKSNDTNKSNAIFKLNNIKSKLKNKIIDSNKKDKLDYGSNSDSNDDSNDNYKDNHIINETNNENSNVNPLKLNHIYTDTHYSNISNNNSHNNYKLNVINCFLEDAQAIGNSNLNTNSNKNLNLNSINNSHQVYSNNITYNNTNTSQNTVSNKNSNKFSNHFSNQDSNNHSNNHSKPHSNHNYKKSLSSNKEISVKTNSNNKNTGTNNNINNIVRINTTNNNVKSTTNLSNSNITINETPIKYVSLQSQIESPSESIPNIPQNALNALTTLNKNLTKQINVYYQQEPNFYKSEKENNIEDIDINATKTLSSNNKHTINNHNQSNNLSNISHLSNKDNNSVETGGFNNKYANTNIINELYSLEEDTNLVINYKINYEDDGYEGDYNNKMNSFVKFSNRKESVYSNNKDGNKDIDNNKETCFNNDNDNTINTVNTANSCLYIKGSESKTGNRINDININAVNDNNNLDEDVISNLSVSFGEDNSNIKSISIIDNNINSSKNNMQQNINNNNTCNKNNMILNNLNKESNSNNNSFIVSSSKKNTNGSYTNNNANNVSYNNSNYASGINKLNIERVVCNSKIKIENDNENSMKEMKEKNNKITLSKNKIRGFNFRNKAPPKVNDNNIISNIDTNNQHTNCSINNRDDVNNNSNNKLVLNKCSSENLNNLTNNSNIISNSNSNNINTKTNNNCLFNLINSKSKLTERIQKLHTSENIYSKVINEEFSLNNININNSCIDLKPSNCDDNSNIYEPDESNSGKGIKDKKGIQVSSLSKVINNEDKRNNINNNVVLKPKKFNFQNKRKNND